MLPKGPNVALIYATEHSNSYPTPTSVATGPTNAGIDKFGNLMTRGPVITDELSFRDDFSGASLSTVLTGVATFTLGSASVTGVGTLFTTEVDTDDYVRLTADGDAAYARVAEVVSDTELMLDTNYAGAGGAGAGDKSHWVPSVSAGGSITVAASLVNLLPGLALGNVTQIVHDMDYGPLAIYAKTAISQRIANQETVIGFQDIPGAPQQQAVLVLDGVDNTKVKLRTSSSSAAADTQETTVTLPTGLDTSQSLTFILMMVQRDVSLLVVAAGDSLSVGEEIIATHSNHIPDPYRVVSAIASIKNTAAVGTPTTLSIDLTFVSNQDRLEVANSFISDPVHIEIMASAPSGQLQGINSDGFGNLQTTNSFLSGNTGVVFGRVATAATAEVAVRQTAYTEQTANFQGSVVSSSANDTNAAGTGARTLRITYYDATMAGPFTEDVALNGAVAVNLVNLTHCFIEKMVVLTVGSTGSNVGTISLFTGLGGAGTLVGTIAATINGTRWCHHYVATGKQCNIATSTTGTTGTIDGLARLRFAQPTVPNAAELQISEFLAIGLNSNSLARYFNIPIKVTGPGRITLYVTPNAVTAVNWFGGIDFQEQ